MARKQDEERADQTFSVKHDANVEQVLLAAALVSREARAKLAKIVPHHDKFHSPQFSAAWAAVLEMERKQVDYDPALMTRMVGERVDVDFLGKLLDARPEPPVDLGPFVKALLWDDVRVRAAKGPASLFVEALADPSCAPEKLKGIVRQLAAVFGGNAGTGQFLRDSDELIRSQVADLEARIAGRVSYPFGIPGLDFYEDDYHDSKGRDLGGTARMTPGAMPKLITLIAADTGVGKSTLAAHLALGQIKQKKRVLYCAWEPDEGMTLELMACIGLGWSRSALIQGRSQENIREAMRADEKARFEEAMHWIAKRVTFMSNPFYKGMKVSNDAHLDLLQEHIESSGADFAICDLLERLLVDKKPDQESGALFRLQSMMKELRAHLCALAQFNKGDESEGKPTKKSITGSKAWSQVPSNVICPYRPALTKNVEDDTMELHIIKQRDGFYPQVVEFEWDGDRGSLKGGKTIPYEPTSAADREDSFGAAFSKKGRKKKKDEF